MMESERDTPTETAELSCDVQHLTIDEELDIGAGVSKEHDDKSETNNYAQLATRYLIRKGRVRDCSQIAILMRKLAESEDYGNRVEVTEEDLRRDGFGESPVFECIVVADREANEEAAILGYALFFMGFCSWKGRLLYLEDVFLESEYRQTGLGLALLQVIGQISERRGCKAIQGTVVEWNKDVMQLYKRIGATDMTENERYHLMAIGHTDVRRFANAKIPVLNNGSQIVTCDV